MADDGLRYTLAAGFDGAADSAAASDVIDPGTLADILRNLSALLRGDV